ncbi:hypothetical protein BGW80DRAFT_876918 [Lactifluus volemus]|nr:hypothetical protein BGW80DRAFT_876918 [Lactifluus volemus]
MSSPSGEDIAAAVARVAQCLSDWRLSSDIAVASVTLSFFDWLLTSQNEFNFLWRRGRITFTHILFVLARYPSLIAAVLSLLPPGPRIDAIKESLRAITILTAELIIMMRTWAMWGRSRWMLVFLVSFLVACIAPGAALFFIDVYTTVENPSDIPKIKGMKQCEVLTSAVGHTWILSYVTVMAFETGVLVLTLYKAVPFRKCKSTQITSKLLNALWIDGLIYFVFMIREPFTQSCWPNHRLPVLVLGMFNIVLVLQVDHPQIRTSGNELQAVLHSVLSTRIVLHIQTVVKTSVIVM